MKYQILLTFTLICVSLFANAQNVQTKQDKINIDGKEVFSYSKNFLIMPNYYVYKLNSRDTVMVISHRDNGTPDFRSDDYASINFPTLKKQLTNEKLLTAEKLVKALVENGAVNTAGTLKPDKIDVFIRKFNQNIIEKK